MAKGKNTQPVSRSNSTALPSSSEKNNFITGQLKLSTHIVIVCAIVVITWLFLQVCLDNQLGTWDDVPYIKENRLVKDLSWAGIRNIFTNPSMGNYHPLTILSFAIEYSLVQFEPWLYHFVNLLLHVMGTALVYWFIFLLTKRPVIAIVTALLFGLHPTHVESVAWVAARKDVLYGFYYLLSCIFYLYYLRSANKKKAWYAAVLVTFILSLLSKPVAVTLPVTLLLIDLFEGRRWGKELFIEKLPHFILSVVFGIIAIKVQRTAGAMDVHKVSYNAVERFALGMYALVTYLWKAIVPADQHCLYLYPDKVKGMIPWLYFIYPLVVAVIIFIVWKYARRNRFIVFGSLFFLVNIFLLLQFLPVGEAIVAERYSYIPYIGLFFIGGWVVSGFFEGVFNPRVKNIVLIVTAAYIGMMGYLANERCKVWYDDVSLWQDEIMKEPQRATQAYNNLGYLYYGKWATASSPAEKQVYFDSAYYLINKAIALRPDYVNPYMALGDLLRAAGKYDEARNNYYRAIKMNPKETNIYVGLAVLHYVMRNMDSAGYYFRMVLQISPTAEAYGNYANLLTETGKDDSALIAFDKAISLSKDNYVLFMNRGKLLEKQNRMAAAEKDIETAMRMNPDVGELYYLRSFCDTMRKNNPLAIQDIEKSAAMGYKHVDTSYYNSLKRQN
jgi:protein O-mannosyl-transferase